MIDQAHKLGDVLRAAREGKGVELDRVERETKIRERYLSALERGDYRELPGAVYTKGFLRNYGAYLGLDPEYLIDLYRLETAELRAERLTAPAPPRPISGRRRSRAFVVTPGAVVAAILTVLVGAFVAYLGYEFVNFARTPELRIVDPAGNVNGHTELSITISGETAPNARVTVSNLRQNPSVVADASGAFEVTVDLVPGSNVVKLVARDPVTRRDSPVAERTVVVVNEAAASATPRTQTLALTAPENGRVVSGPVEVTGTAPAGASVAVTASLERRPTPNFRITDAGGTPVDFDVAEPAVPDPVELTADESGAFSGTIDLPAGGWLITVETEGIAPVQRAVPVPATGGLAATVRLDGGDSYLELEEDGTAVAEGSGGIAADGDGFRLAADNELRVFAGNAGAVRVTINGVRVGVLGAEGAVVEWRITRGGS